jgi:peptidylprolyl isomerase
MSGAEDQSRSVIPGWSAGLVGQKVGSLVQLAIPSEEAYGAQGQGPIAANDPLVFVIQIISASDEPPVEATTTVPAGEAPTDTSPDVSTATTP